MEWLSQIGLATFLMTLGVTGVRLVVRGVRSGQAPERALGCVFIFGGLGYVPLVIAWSGDLEGSRLVWTQALAQVALELSAANLLVFNAQVFRPGNPAVRSLVVIACVLLASNWVGLLVTKGFASRSLEHPIWIFDCSVRACGSIWATIEAFYAFAQARRRRRIGLGDAVVSDRFALWGVCNAAICAIFANFVYGQILGGGSPPPSWYLTDAGLALLASASVWVAFFPPRAYLRWRRPAAAADPTAA